jgi:hypothetical protein
MSDLGAGGMRRTTALAIALGAVLATTGVAVAGERDGGPAHTQVPPAAVVPLTPAGTGLDLERIGTVEQVDQVLGYLGARRSTTFHYPGASYLKVHFSRLMLAEGDYVTVSDPARREVHRVATATEDGWAMSVTGDRAVVELHTGGGDALGIRQRLAQLGVAVDRVARGYSAGELAANARADDQRRRGAARRLGDANGHEESVCGARDDKRDAVCYRSSRPVVYRNSKAVARLLINGVELCSAWRVGPNNRMFTNHHCFTDTRDARDTEVWFNFECTVCGGWSDDVRPITKVWGDEVFATDETLDYTLFSVDDFAAVEGFGHLDLDLRELQRGEALYIPQHPAGSPTKLTVDTNCDVVDPYYDGYDVGTDVSYYCDTAGGSSGSPVLSSTTDKVIALHHFGGCPNSGVRIDLIYDEVGDLL